MSGLRGWYAVLASGVRSRRSGVLGHVRETARKPDDVRVARILRSCVFAALLSRITSAASGRFGLRLEEYTSWRDRRGSVCVSSRVRLLSVPSTPHPVATRIFQFEDHPIRTTVAAEGEKTFYAVSDIDRLIGRNAAQAVAALDDDEKALKIFDTLGGPQRLIAVTESGLYTLALQAHGATTSGTVQHRFRRWATSEVLLQIRATGAYVAPGSFLHRIQQDQGVRRLLEGIANLPGFDVLVDRAGRPARASPRTAPRSTAGSAMRSTCSIRPCSCPSSRPAARRSTPSSRRSIWPRSSPPRWDRRFLRRSIRCRRPATRSAVNRPAILTPYRRPMLTPFARG